MRMCVEVLSGALLHGAQYNYPRPCEKYACFAKLYSYFVENVHVADES